MLTRRFLNLLLGRLALTNCDILIFTFSNFYNNKKQHDIDLEIIGCSPLSVTIFHIYDTEYLQNHVILSRKLISVFFNFRPNMTEWPFRKCMQVHLWCNSSSWKWNAIKLFPSRHLACSHALSNIFNYWWILSLAAKRIDANQHNMTCY